MALKADNATDRAEQLLLLTGRLQTLIGAERALLETGSPLDGAGASDELRRLANAYRLEMAQIRDDRSLIDGAPLALRRQLETATQTLQSALDGYMTSLSAVRVVTEGLVQAVAEEMQRTNRPPSGYGASGGYAAATPVAIAVDRRA